MRSTKLILKSPNRYAVNLEFPAIYYAADAREQEILDRDSGKISHFKIVFQATTGSNTRFVDVTPELFAKIKDTFKANGLDTYAQGIADKEAGAINDYLQKEHHSTDALKIIQPHLIETFDDCPLAIRRGNKVCCAQWEDCGPFFTDHWQYAFGNERPKSNLNQNAGLDVSPAVRDYLGLDNIDVCDWRFVDIREVPAGPWAMYGDNTIFVILRRQSTDQLGH
jgi:hypothetical protein